MQVLLDWLRRIVQIGILNLLRTLGWRVWAGILLGLVGLVIVLILIIVALL